MYSGFRTACKKYHQIRVILLSAIIFACSGDINYTPPQGSKDIAITHYSFGKIIIDGKSYENDVAIFSDGTVKTWQAKINHAIQLDDIKDLIDDSTKILIIGIGADKNCTLTDDIAPYCQSKGVELTALDTYEAVKLFNKRMKTGLAACFHINC